MHLQTLLKLFLIKFLLTASVLGQDHAGSWSKLERWTRDYLLNVTNHFESRSDEWKSVRKLSNECRKSLIQLANGIKNLDLAAVKSKLKIASVSQ